MRGEQELPVRREVGFFTCVSRCDEPLRQERWYMKAAQLVDAAIIWLGRSTMTQERAIERTWLERGGDPARTAGGIEAFKTRAEAIYGGSIGHTKLKAELARLRKLARPKTTKYGEA